MHAIEVNIRIPSDPVKYKKLYKHYVVSMLMKRLSSSVDLEVEQG